MRFAICNETYEGWSLEKTCASIRQYGYQGIEIAPFTLGSSLAEITPEQRREARQSIRDNGLECVGLHWLLAKTQGLHLTSPDATVQQRTSDYLAELGRLCDDLGGRIMVLGSPQQRNLPDGVTHDQGLEYAASIIRGAMPALLERNVTLAVEPLGPEEGDFLRTAEQAIVLIDMVGSPNCKLHLDVKAMSSEDKPIIEIIRDSAEHLAHFHANDPNRRGPGMGKIDFAPIFETLHEVRYDGWVSVEVFDYEPDPETIAFESIRYMQQTLGEASEG